jgi:hypothetical protein
MCLKALGEKRTAPASYFRSKNVLFCFVGFPSAVPKDPWLRHLFMKVLFRKSQKPVRSSRVFAPFQPTEKMESKYSECMSKKWGPKGAPRGAHRTYFIVTYICRLTTILRHFIFSENLLQILATVKLSNSSMLTVAIFVLLNL